MPLSCRVLCGFLQRTAGVPLGTRILANTDISCRSKRLERTLHTQIMYKHRRANFKLAVNGNGVAESPSVVNMSTESSSQKGEGEPMMFRQLLDYRSFTYTYLMADPASRKAILIDPVIDMVDRDVALVRDLGLDLKYAMNTHVHADHITGTGEIKKRIPGCQSVISKVSGAKADIHLVEGSIVRFGPYQLECYSTPGHTDGCMSYVLRSEGMVFSGDAVLIRGCGRTDFQQGDAGRLYDSVHSKILSLPRHFKIFPAHDYTGQTSSTVGEELQHNRRLTRTRDEFIEIMKNLNLPYPKQIDKALPANLVCGVFDEPQQKES